MMYSGREMSSSMTKSVMKSLAIGKSIMPPSEKSMSGKPSVPIQPAWRDSASSALPGRSAAWAAKAPSPALVRSAMTRMASRPMTSMTPWAATPKGSSLKPGVSALPEPSRTASQRAARATADPTMASTPRPVWQARRALRGTKASRRMPRTAAPRMTMTGESPAQEMVGAVTLTW